MLNRVYRIWLFQKQEEVACLQKHRNARRISIKGSTSRLSRSVSSLMEKMRSCTHGLRHSNNGSVRQATYQVWHGLAEVEERYEARYSSRILLDEIIIFHWLPWWHHDITQCSHIYTDIAIYGAIVSSFLNRVRIHRSSADPLSKQNNKREHPWCPCYAPNRFFCL